MADRVFVVNRTLLGASYLAVATSANAGGSTGGVHSLIFKGENPRSNLNSLSLAMALLKALF
jgi:hypothetical protein